MKTYTIYVRTFQGIRNVDKIYGTGWTFQGIHNVDNSNKLDKIYDTGWSVYATVVGAKELVNTLLNSKYKKSHAKEWCKKHWVYNKDDIDVSEDDILYSLNCKFNVYSAIDNRGHEVDLMNIVRNFPHPKKVYKFRCGSVPGISKGQWKFANYYRKFPKPKRDAEDVIDEVRMYTRNYKVKDHVTPNTWDDIERSDVRDRSWKRHRDNQFKRSKPSYKAPKTDVEENLGDLDENSWDIE